MSTTIVREERRPRTVDEVRDRPVVSDSARAAGNGTRETAAAPPGWRWSIDATEGEAAAGAERPPRFDLLQAFAWAKVLGGW